jgi:putative sigma-54 modulation protein
MSKIDAPINISVTFRHTDPTEALKSYADEKIGACLQKYLSHPADVNVVLLVEKRDHVAEVIVHSKGHDVTAKAVNVDLYAAIDKVVDLVDAQVRKQKDRIVKNKHQPKPELEL